MNKKGQMEIGKEVGLIIMVAITLIVGLILLQGVISEQTKSTTLGAVNTTKGNDAVTVAYNTSIYLEGKSVSNFVAHNASTGNLVGSGNYTITNNFKRTDTGDLTVRLVISDAEIGDAYAMTSLNVSYDYQPLGYIDSGGGRAIAGLIAIFFALAVAVIALVPTLRSGVLNMINK